MALKLWLSAGAFVALTTHLVKKKTRELTEQMIHQSTILHVFKDEYSLPSGFLK
jgi:hypothetical protein